MWRIFDQYELRARLTPAILLLVPIAVTLGLVIPLDTLTVGSGIASGIIGLAVLYVTAQAVGYFGRRFQPGLFEKWDGAPSTRFLRWRDGHCSPEQKKAIAEALCHEFGLTLPTEQEEVADPMAADRRVSDAFARARSRLYANQVEGPWRSHLAEYGLARNLLGAVRIAAAVGIGLGVIDVVLACFMSNRALIWAGVFCLIWAGLFILGSYTFLISLAKHLGDRYADTAWLAFLSTAKTGGHA